MPELGCATGLGKPDGPDLARQEAIKTVMRAVEDESSLDWRVAAQGAVSERHGHPPEECLSLLGPTRRDDSWRGLETKPVVEKERKISTDEIPYTKRTAGKERDGNAGRLMRGSDDKSQGEKRRKFII